MGRVLMVTVVKYHLRYRRALCYDKMSIWVWYTRQYRVSANLFADTEFKCDTEFCFFFNIQPEPITNYKNRKINTRFATNTCCVKIGNRRRGGYTESDNRLKQTLYGKALQSHED